jgi:hypothetical protein
MSKFTILLAILAYYILSAGNYNVYTLFLLDSGNECQTRIHHSEYKILTEYKASIQIQQVTKLTKYTNVLTLGKNSMNSAVNNRRKRTAAICLSSSSMPALWTEFRRNVTFDSTGRLL